MGSFNVACKVSRMSINPGDECVFIPLIRNTYKDKNDRYTFDGVFTVSNDGPAERFVPVALPIFGEYDSYGRLENIEKSPITEDIVEFWELSSIDQFIDRIISQDIFIGEYDEYCLNGMYVLREVWDYLVYELSAHERDESTFNVFDHSSFNSVALDLLGFEYYEKVTTIDRYNHLYKHPEVDNFFVGMDNSGYSRIYQKIDHSYAERKAMTYRVIDFIIAWERITETKLDLSQIEDLRFGDLVYLKYVKKFAEMGNRLDNMRDEGDLEDDEERTYIKSFKKAIVGEFRNRIPLGGYAPKVGLLDVHSGLFENREDYQDVWVSLYTLHCHLYQLNILYEPSWNGYQHGAAAAEKHFYQFLGELSENRLEELNRW